ncbi:hypothetical protein [Brevibacillus centrosporus]|uniref:hypothetical protein n=1 Tax=Brevibacillus centrosporus TaxID=54910 RepID=UPI002E1D6E41|nr:hypothetical protein [Brevibacillus centrosporus]
MADNPIDQPKKKGVKKMAVDIKKLQSHTQSSSGNWKTISHIAESHISKSGYTIKDVQQYLKDMRAKQ